MATSPSKHIRHVSSSTKFIGSPNFESSISESFDVSNWNVKLKGRGAGGGL